MHTATYNYTIINYYRTHLINGLANSSVPTDSSKIRIGILPLLPKRDSDIRTIYVVENEQIITPRNEQYGSGPIGGGYFNTLHLLRAATIIRTYVVLDVFEESNIEFTEHQKCSLEVLRLTHLFFPIIEYNDGSDIKNTFLTVEPFHVDSINTRKHVDNNVHFIDTTIEWHVRFLTAYNCMVNNILTIPSQLVKETL